MLQPRSSLNALLVQASLCDSAARQAGAAVPCMQTPTAHHQTTPALTCDNTRHCRAARVRYKACSCLPTSLHRPAPPLQQHPSCTGPTPSDVTHPAVYSRTKRTQRLSCFSANSNRDIPQGTLPHVSSRTPSNLSCTCAQHTQRPLASTILHLSMPCGASGAPAAVAAPLASGLALRRLLCLLLRSCCPAALASFASR